MGEEIKPTGWVVVCWPHQKAPAVMGPFATEEEATRWQRVYMSKNAVVADAEWRTVPIWTPEDPESGEEWEWNP